VAAAFALGSGLLGSAARAQEAPSGARPQSGAPGAAPSAAPAKDAQNAGPSAQDVKNANNPLANLIALNLQNFYAPSLSEVPDASLSTFVLRAVTPVWRLLPRFTLPFVNLSLPGDPATNTPATNESGLGDFNAFVTFLFTQPTDKLQFGAGPLYVAPTATEDALGAGKHQIGVAVVGLYSEGPLLTGALVQYQNSFAGDDDRDTTRILTAQPLLILQAGGGFYLRSAATWQFNFESGDYNVPIGVGAGKVVIVDRTIVNMFLEPEFTVLSEGPLQPLFQLFAGINLQYKL
jgi:hypothetical protein